jgi:hypothetical protein
MSSDSTLAAEAINLPQSPATVLIPASDLAAILSEVRSLRTDLTASERRTANLPLELPMKLMSFSRKSM